MARAVAPEMWLLLQKVGQLINTYTIMKIQTATAGMSLTDGETYCKTVYLSDEADYWQEDTRYEVPVIE